MTSAKKRNHRVIHEWMGLFHVFGTAPINLPLYVYNYQLQMLSVIDPINHVHLYGKTL